MLFIELLNNCIEELGGKLLKIARHMDTLDRLIANEKNSEISKELNDQFMVMGKEMEEVRLELKAIIRAYMTYSEIKNLPLSFNFMKLLKEVEK